MLKVSRNIIVHSALFVCACQFSGQCADEMLKTYSEFCSRHIKAVKLYKELLARDKRLQLFIRVRTRMTMSMCVMCLHNRVRCCLVCFKWEDRVVLSDE